MSRAQKNQRAWWEFEKYGNFEKLSTGNFIFPKNVTGSFSKIITATQKDVTGKKTLNFELLDFPQYNRLFTEEKNKIP